MVTGKEAPEVAATSKENVKPEEVIETKKSGGFLATYKVEIAALGIALIVLSPLLYVTYFFVSSYFERVGEIKMLNRKLDAAVMLACKVSYRKDQTKVSFQKVENSEGRTVMVLKCEPEPVTEKGKE